MGQIVTIAGVSGSGKSTLIHDVLYQNWLMYSSEKTGAEDTVEDSDEEVDTGVNSSGFEHLDEIVMMEQGALGRSLRACVATMTKAYTGIRQLMARQPEAVESGMTAGHFSFNMDLGRCPECEGL